jgi:hypothetical protein
LRLDSRLDSRLNYSRLKYSRLNDSRLNDSRLNYPRLHSRLNDFEAQLVEAL